MLRDKFEEQVKPQKPMILAKSNKNDLYENISDDFLTLRSNSMRAKAERMAKCRSVPMMNLQPDEQYFKQPLPQQPSDGFMQRRNQWSTASYQKSVLGQRNSNSRRSMSILDQYEVNNKENCVPARPCLKKDPPPPLRPKLKSIEVLRGSPKAYRLSSGASLSPRSNIFG